MSRYKSEIYDAIYQDAIADYEVGAISEAEMREYDELCLTEEALQDTAAQGDIAHETVNIEHADLVTA
jgi:DNA-binding transcriptional regulator YiaG